MSGISAPVTAFGTAAEQAGQIAAASFEGIGAAAAASSESLASLPSGLEEIGTAAEAAGATIGGGLVEPLAYVAAAAAEAGEAAAAAMQQVTASAGEAAPAVQETAGAMAGAGAAGQTASEGRTAVQIQSVPPFGNLHLDGRFGVARRSDGYAPRRDVYHQDQADRPNSVGEAVRWTSFALPISDALMDVRTPLELP